MEKTIFGFRQRLMFLLAIALILVTCVFTTALIGDLRGNVFLLALLWGPSFGMGLVMANSRIEIEGKRIRQYDLFGRVVLDDLLANACKIEYASESDIYFQSVTANFQPAECVSLNPIRKENNWLRFSCRLQKNLSFGLPKCDTPVRRSRSGWIWQRCSATAPYPYCSLWHRLRST